MSADRYLTRQELVEFLNGHGFPISKSTIAKLSMPSRGSNDGPTPEGRWGNRDLYRADRALAWAKARFKMRANARL
jgi:hypothetical protein